MMGDFIIQLTVVKVHMNGKGSTHSFSVHGLTIRLSKNQLKVVAFIMHNF